MIALKKDYLFTDNLSDSDKKISDFLFKLIKRAFERGK